LKLSSCNCLQWLPEAIGNLADLQYLNMSECQEIKKLPESIMKLHNLLHLDLSGCGGMEMWLVLGRSLWPHRNTIPGSVMDDYFS